jgi:hypothetical protein
MKLKDMSLKLIVRMIFDIMIIIEHNNCKINQIKLSKTTNLQRVKRVLQRVERVLGRVD